MKNNLAAMFLTALVAVLVMIGVALSSLGWVVLSAYSAVVLVGAVFAVRRAARTKRHAAGRTCTCCTTTVFDAVEVR
jgi:hypothetical protein